MTKAEKILNKCEHILDDYDADYRGGYVDVIDGTTYIVFKYYGGKHDTIDRNDDSWDEMYELEGVADVGYGSGYGMDNTKYEDMLLIELEDGLNESKNSARKSIKESKYKVSDFKNTSNKEVSISYVDEDDNPLWVGSPDELEDCDYSDYDVEEVGEEGNTLYLSIEESKKSMRKSIKEAKNITFSDLCDELGISYMDIYAIGYDDGDADGISYYCDEMLKVGIKILKNEAIQITGLGTFIGKFNFNDYIKYPTSNTSILLQDKSRLLDIYLK